MTNIVPPYQRVILIGEDGNAATLGSTVEIAPGVFADVVTAGDVATATVTLPSGATGLTAEIDLGDRYRLARIVIPASWTAANLTFQTAPASGGTFSDLYDAFGNEYTITAAASRAIIVPFIDFFGIRFLKIRSGTAGTPVSQAADRTLTIIKVPV